MSLPISRKTSALLKQLQQVPLFGGVDDDRLVELVWRCRRRNYGPQVVLFHEGDPGHTLYIILSGQVSIQRINQHGQTVPIARRGPGDHIGELSLLDGSLRTADAVTTEQSELLMLDSEVFNETLNNDPKMARKMLASLASRLRDAADSADVYQSKDVTSRLCTYLLVLAAARGEIQDDGSLKLSPNVSQQMMAEHISATRESVNRVIGLLRKADVIQTFGQRCYIMDMERLRQWSGE